MTNEKTDNLAGGRSLGHYRIISKIGAGGMGEVYLAEDTKLARRVALKILPAEFAEDKDRMNRFVREAKSASALNHPNIITIHEIGESEGTHFITTEFIDGKTLNEYAKSSPLNLKSALEIAIQIASALDEAHSAGIVHRDIKPDNVMIRSNGLAKILDFGIAKLTDSTNQPSLGEEAATAIKSGTTPGMIIGTPNYMSPEQAKGQAVDARSDIFSFGVVLYEMMAGSLPFEGESAMEMIGAILHKEPKPLPSDIPAEITKIIGKCLRKNRDERYQTVKDVLIDVQNVKQNLEFQDKLEHSIIPNQEEKKTQILQATTADEIKQTTTNQTAANNPAKKYLTAALAILLVSAIGFFGYRYLTTNHNQIESIAVMPFVNESGSADTEYLSDGMTESLINSLSQLPKLSVKARSSVFRYKGKEIEPQTIGSELSVQAILNGRVVERGDNLTLSLELVDTKTGNQIWGEQYNRKTTDLVSLQNEIARDVSNKLRTKLSGAEQNQIAKNYTTNTEAYQLYLKGRYHWNKRTGADIRKSIEYFQQAIDKDPTYALAYAALAESYVLIPSYTKDSPHDAYPKARAAAMKALEIDETLAEVHAALATINEEYDWKFAEAEREYKRAIKLNPNDATTRQWYGEYLLAVGRNEEAIAEIKRAQELDPLSLIINSILGFAYTENRQYAQAIEQFRKTIEMDQNFPRAHLYLASAYEAKGMYEEAISEYEKHAVSNGAPPVEVAKETAAIREAYKKSGANGYWRKQIEIYERMQVLQPDSVPPLSVVASYYAQIGEKEQAFALLEKAYEKREVDVSYLRLPVYDLIRSDPRFLDLLRRIGLPQ